MHGMQTPEDYNYYYNDDNTGQGSRRSQIRGIRLIDSDGTTGGSQGRVEVLYNGRWGTICDDSWSNNDGRVACRYNTYLPNIIL